MVHDIEIVHLGKSKFEYLNSLTRRFYIPIIIIWIIIIIGSTFFIPSFFNATTYNLTDSTVSSPDDSESEKAQAIIASQFSSPISEGGSAGGDSIILVIRNDEIYSNNIRTSLLSLEDVINSDDSIRNFNGISSIYSMESDLILSFMPSLISQTQDFGSSIELTNKGLYDLQENIIAIHMGIFDSDNGVNETAQNQIIYFVSSYVGISPEALIEEISALSSTPNSEAISNLTVNLFTRSLSNQNSSLTSLISYGSADFDVSMFIRSVYDLGSSPSETSIWGMTSGIIAGGTSQSLSLSPLFTVNESELLSLLLSVYNVEDIELVIKDRIRNQNIDDYPFILSPNLSENFVNEKNNTMLAILSFSNSLNSSDIHDIKNVLESSSLYTNAEVYATGNSIFAEDMSEIFETAESYTVIAGVVMSLIIAGFLFRSPIAAVFPLLIAGVSILISYPAIYFGVVVIGQGSISFMTPMLATLLMLGLGVDYSVILLRRTREERRAGKTKIESVGISTKWGGQAVLTAGIAVIASYVVMAIANVPMFSDVGMAIAIGVGVLLVVSVTLVPSLEILFGDKLFWPIKIRKEDTSKTEKSILSKIADVTLNRKIPIVIGILLLGAGSLYVTQTTPTGMDFSKLLPDFPSNQGMTEIAENMGSDAISPTLIPVSMSTPIVDGSNQFDFAVFDIIEQISTTIENSNGISSVISTSRPYGEIFDYRSVYNLPEPIRSQYLSGIFDTIGNDNKTVLITVGLSSAPFGSDAISSVLEVQSNINDLSLPSNIIINYGGLTQSTYESDALLDAILPQIIIILVIVIYILLFLQLFSAYTPLRLIFTVLTSVVVSLAFIFGIFHYTLDIPIVSFVPLFVAVTMLGVGIDYDIFLVTRIREEVLKGKSDNEAIKTAITKTGGTIIGLGLILASVFSSLIFTGIPIMAEIGLAVSTAVLFDSIIVILFVVPALMGMAQRLNWWPTKPKRDSDKKPSK